MKVLGIQNGCGYTPNAKIAEQDPPTIRIAIEIIRAIEYPFVNGSTTGDII